MGQRAVHEQGGGLPQSYYGPHCGTVSSLLGYIKFICKAIFRLYKFLHLFLPWLRDVFSYFFAWQIFFLLWGRVWV